MSTVKNPLLAGPRDFPAVLRRFASLSIAGVSAYWDTFAHGMVGGRERGDGASSAGSAVSPLTLSM